MVEPEPETKEQKASVDGDGVYRNNFVAPTSHESHDAGALPPLTHTHRHTHRHTHTHTHTYTYTHTHTHTHIHTHTETQTHTALPLMNHMMLVRYHHTTTHATNLALSLFFSLA